MGKTRHGPTKRKNRIKIPAYDYLSMYENADSWSEESWEKAGKWNGAYAIKVITAGDQVETEMYPIFRKKSDIPPDARKRGSAKAQQNLDDKNSQKQLIRLINANFGRGDIWGTFNYEPGKRPESIEDARKDWSNFVKRINRIRKKKGLPNAKFVYVMENPKGKKGNYHFHFVMDGSLPMDLVESLWTKGRRNQIRKLDPDEDGLTGMGTYITKGNRESKGQRIWSASRGLKQPEVKVLKSIPKKPGMHTRPIQRYVREFRSGKGAPDPDLIRSQLQDWFPDCTYRDCRWMSNPINCGIYIYARMRRIE